jgi:hypothetical protein
MAKTGGYTGLRDMFDGGGAGKSGATFEGGGALSRAGNAMGIAPAGQGQGSYAPGGINTNDPGSRVNRVVAAFDSPQGAPTAADRPVTRTSPAPMAGPAPTQMRGDSGRERTVAQAPIQAPVLPPVVPATVSPFGGSDSMDSGNLIGEEVSRRNAERSRVPTYEAGGMVGPGGVPMRPSTASLDLPPALARMLAMPTQSYAEGGMVGPGGIPQRPMGASPMAMNVAQQGGAPVVGLAPQGGQGRPLNFAAIDQQAQQFMQQNPQQVAQIKAQVEQAMASGEIDAQSLNMFVQIATTALQNPEMWPQLRQVLIRQGMLDAEEVGEEYDQGFLIILYIIGKTMGTGAQGAPAAPQQSAPMSAGQAPQMSMAKGGALPAKSANPDGSIPINAHEGEYVIPADVTRKLGTNHFDKLIAKARGVDLNGDSSDSKEGES